MSEQRGLVEEKLKDIGSLTKKLIDLDEEKLKLRHELSDRDYDIKI